MGIPRAVWAVSGVLAASPMGPPVLREAQGCPSWASRLARCSSGGWTEATRRKAINHCLCTGERAVQQVLEAQDPKLKWGLREARALARSAPPAMRRSFRWVGLILLFLKKHQKGPCPGVLGWVCSLAVFLPEQPPTPQSQAARAARYCNSNNYLFTSWSKEESASRGREGGAKHNLIL